MEDFYRTSGLPYAAASAAKAEERIAKAKAETKRKLYWGLGTMAFAICWFPVGVSLLGNTFATLWRWFVVPVFHLPTLTFAQAYGLLLAASVLRFSLKDEDLKAKNDEPDEAFRKTAMRALVTALFCGLTLAMAWVFRAIFF